MKQDLIIYHGSQQIVETPKFGIGKKYNDYGQGFYCTESIERNALDPRQVQHPQLACHPSCT